VRTVRVAWITAVVLVAAALAVPQGPPTFGVSADLVMIDMIATDSDGRSVADLRADEIEVFEDGKAQRVEFARYVTAGGRAPETSPVSPATPAPSRPAEAAEAEPLRPEPLSLVAMVDVATMPHDALTRTRQAIIQMVRGELEEGTRLMLVSVNRGVEVRQTFTDDVERFVAAVENLPSPAIEAEAALSTLIDDVVEGCEALQGTPAANTPAGVQNAITAARGWVENAKLGMTASLEGMGALARYLSSLPGRKHVVFYSGGYAMDPSAIALRVMEDVCVTTPAGSGFNPIRAELQTAVRTTQNVDSSGMLHVLLDEANRAQVSVYTVDARGLVGDVAPARARATVRLTARGTLQEVLQRHIREPQDILYSIANGTGGTTSINTNELARGMRAAARDARGYYLVAYAPAGARKEGRFYPLNLKVKRPGLHLRYRRGYEWLSEAKRSERAVTAALRFPGLYAENGLALDVWMEGGRLHVAAIIPTRSLTFRAEAGEHRNEITLLGLLRDEQGRPVGERYLFSKTVNMKLPQARYEDLLTRDNVEIANEADPPKPGRYQVAVVARHSGGRLASSTIDLTVP
jgi:VWFA-related protein